MSEGPQIVTQHGRETGVVLEIGAYRRLLGVPMDFKQFLMSAPDFSQLDLERDRSRPREADL